MRRFLASIAFVGCAAFASPFAAAATTVPADTSSAVAVQQLRVSAHGIRDEAAMVIVGTALICLAAAVRRAVRV